MREDAWLKMCRRPCVRHELRECSSRQLQFCCAAPGQQAAELLGNGTLSALAETERSYWLPLMTLLMVVSAVASRAEIHFHTLSPQNEDDSKFSVNELHEVKAYALLAPPGTCAGI